MKKVDIISQQIFLLSYLSLTFICCSSAHNTKQPQARTVEIRQMQFQPSTLRVNKFDTVIFVNHDFVDHNITEESGRGWTSSSLPPGKSWKFIITQSAGYYCTIHPVMKGELLVEMPKQ